MAAFATVADYETRAGMTVGSLAEPQRSQVAAYLDDATALMGRHIPAGYEPDPATLTAICVAIVRRTMANPGGYRARTMGVYSETLGEDGGLYLADEEKDQLQPPEEDDPDADAAYTVGLVDQAPYGWAPDPGAAWGPW